MKRPEHHNEFLLLEKREKAAFLLVEREVNDGKSKKSRGKSNSNSKSKERSRSVPFMKAKKMNWERRRTRSKDFIYGSDVVRFWG